MYVLKHKLTFGKYTFSATALTIYTSWLNYPVDICSKNSCRSFGSLLNWLISSDVNAFVAEGSVTRLTLCGVDVNEGSVTGLALCVWM